MKWAFLDLARHLFFWHNISTVPQDSIKVVQFILGSEVLPISISSPKVICLSVVLAAYGISHNCFQVIQSLLLRSSVLYLWHHQQHSGAGSNGQSTKFSGGNWDRNGGVANDFGFLWHTFCLFLLFAGGEFWQSFCSLNSFTTFFISK